MKKLISMYQKYMFRPVLYKSVTRVSVVAVLMLLWDRYVSDGRFTMWQAPALLLGVVLLAWAWVNYLRLDGVTVHHLEERIYCSMLSNLILGAALLIISLIAGAV